MALSLHRPSNGSGFLRALRSGRCAYGLASLFPGASLVRCFAPGRLVRPRPRLPRRAGRSRALRSPAEHARVRRPQLRRGRPLREGHGAGHDLAGPARSAQRRDRGHRRRTSRRAGARAGRRRRGAAAARRCGTRQRHAAGGRAEPRPQARAATVRRCAAARCEQQRARGRRRDRLPRAPGLHDGVDRVAGGHPVGSRPARACRAGAARRHRPGT